MSILLLHLGDVSSGIIIKRPSQYCKTPYVADVQLENGEEILGHSPSLGCCGLAEKDSLVIMSKMTNSSTVT